MADVHPGRGRRAPAPGRRCRPRLILILSMAAALHPVCAGAQEDQPQGQGAPAQDAGQGTGQQAPADPAQAQAQPQEDKVTVRGSVFDGLNKINMIGATVKVAAQGIETTTDDNGEYAFVLPAGAHVIEISFESYKTLQIPIVIPPAAPGAGPQEVTVRKVTLQVEVVLLKKTETYVIREPRRDSQEAQNLVRKNAAAARDIVSAEEIKKSADGSASQAAARVVGATVVGDRFVYVRGLGERYSNALFNGAPLPSPEPDQQAVPFDIFPASLLANLTIAKAATADIPGDFAGGSVQINTQEFPSRLQLQLSATLGANLSTAFQPFLTYPGGKLDGLGFDDGSRAIPARQPGESDASYFKRFPNLWSPRRQAYGPPNFGLAASLGSQGTVRGTKIGYLVSLNYGAEAQTRAEELNIFNVRDEVQGGQTVKVPNLLYGYTGERGTESVQWGSLASVSISPNPLHRIGFSGIFVQNADKETRIYEGPSLAENISTWYSRLRWIDRTFGFLQLTGTHRFEKARRKLKAGELEWRATYAYAARSEPDNREIIYRQPGVNVRGRCDYLVIRDGQYGDGERACPYQGGGTRFFSDNREHQIAAGADYTQEFDQWSGLLSRFKAGALLRYRMRDFQARRFKYGFDGLNVPDQTAGPEEIFAPANLERMGNGEPGFRAREQTNPTDRYDAQMGVYAAYGMIDLPLHARLRAVAGVRFEASRQHVNAVDPFTGDRPLPVDLDTYDALPSLNLVSRVTDAMNLRAGLSMTVARPELRELAPFQFTDYVGGATVIGNPELQRTRIVNADLRWEWFAGTADLLAVSAFYKYFDQPIETVLDVGGSGLIRSFANARSAHVAGAELEGRKDLSRLRLRGLNIGGNLSGVYSRVNLPEIVKIGGKQGASQYTNRERPLQGQSPFMLNAFVEYELDRGPRFGLQMRLSYNVFGARIDQVGAVGLPDMYEQPRHQLDLTVSARLPRGFSLRLVAKNLIDSPYHVKQGDETALRYHFGRVVNLTLGYQYQEASR